MIEARILKGFRDALPDSETRRLDLQRKLEDCFRLFGYVPIDTPALEYAEILLGKAGGETEKQVYRFLHHERDISLRFDLTVPFARYMVMHKNELYLPFRRYHMAKVWRGEAPQKGRYREFMQCDFNLVGPDTVAADLEILLLMGQAVHTASAADFTVQFSHRGIFNEFLGRLGLLDKSVDILRIVDKLGKIGEAEVKSQLLQLSPAAENILSFIGARDDFDSTMANVEALLGQVSEHCLRIRQLWDALNQLGESQRYVFNPAITRGLDYYTGVVFETYLNKLPGIGSVCSGGRYNDLVGLYGNETLPGVGASVGLDRLLAAMSELQPEGQKSASLGAAVFLLDDGLWAYGQSLARILRDAGIPCEVMPEKKKLGQAFAYAEKKGLALAVIAGSTEKEAGTVQLKNIVSRETRNAVTLKALALEAKSLLGRN